MSAPQRPDRTQAACRICRASGLFPHYRVREMLHGTREAFDYVECEACGCVQIADIPADMGRFYPADYFSFRDWRGLDRNPVRRLVDRRRVRFTFGARDWLGGLAERISRPFDYVTWVREAGLGPDARVLDVGCGAGKTLLNMALGGFPAPTGVDPFIDETLRYDCGVVVHKMNLEDFAADRAGAFDLIMFHSSLEHLADPLAALRCAAAMLAGEGRILITVPVADSFAWEHYREHWFALDPPRHIHVFTRAGMDVLAGDAALAVVSTKSMGVPSQFSASERYRRDIPTSDKRSDRSLFSRAELADFRRRSRALNLAGRGDQAMFSLARS